MLGAFCCMVVTHLTSFKPPGNASSPHNSSLTEVEGYSLQTDGCEVGRKIHVLQNRTLYGCKTLCDAYPACTAFVHAGHDHTSRAGCLLQDADSGPNDISCDSKSGAKYKLYAKSRSFSTSGWVAPNRCPVMNS